MNSAPLQSEMHPSLGDLKNFKEAPVRHTTHRGLYCLNWRGIYAQSSQPSMTTLAPRM